MKRLDSYQARNQRGESPLEKFSLSLEKYGQNLKVLDIVLKNWATLRKLFTPP